MTGAGEGENLVFEGAIVHHEEGNRRERDRGTGSEV
jgi:hypothetical protein